MKDIVSGCFWITAIFIGIPTTIAFAAKDFGECHTEVVETIKLEGKQSQEAGLPIESCPYPESSLGSPDWKKGWIESRIQNKR